MRNAVVNKLFILLLFLISIVSGLFSQDGELDFEHLTEKEGLPSPWVNAIEQDNLGYMWFGTRRGLCRYNGYEMDRFESVAFDSTFHGYPVISYLYEDRDHDLWIGTRGGGLYKFNRPEDSFTSIPFAAGDIHAISQDVDGYLWVGTSLALYRYDKVKEKDYVYQFWSADGSREEQVLSISQFKDRVYVNISGLGILEYNRENDNFTSVLLLEDCKDRGISEINELFPYNNQILWLGTDQGLYEFFISGDGGLHRVEDAGGTHIPDEVNCIIKDSNNRVWIGAEGLYMYDVISGTFQRYVHDISLPHTISNNYITCGFEDEQGNLWFGTNASGIDVRKNSSVDFHKHSVINRELDKFSKNITAITRDMDGNLWLGTWNKGVLIFDMDHHVVDAYHHRSPELQALGEENIRVMEQGPDKGIWIGSSSGLLTRISPDEKPADVFRIPVPEEQEVKSCHLTCLLFEQDSLLWIGTSTNGLFLLDIHHREFLDFKHRERVCDLNIVDLEKDRSGNVWIASYNDGIFRMDKDHYIGKYLFEGLMGEKIRDASFTSIYQDSNEEIWFGAQSHGLLKLTTGNEIIVHPVSSELGNREVSSITEDPAGNLWLGTSRGIGRLNESRKVFRRYSWEDGLVTSVFNYNSSFQSQDHTIYLGGNSGLVYFDPLSIRENPIPPPVYIETFYLDNQEVKPGLPGSPLSHPVNQTSKITLKHSQDVIGFEVAALNYIATSKNQYAYLLEGYQESVWNELGTRRSMTFTNLDFGKYVLRVRASNNDGVWNEEGASISIHILPPFWLSWWAWVLYGIGLCILVYLLYTRAMQRISMKQQIRMQRYEKEQQEQLSDMKLQFFTNISHEFKVPLSLIISPLEEMINNFRGSNETRQKLLMMKRNAGKLLLLIKQLIDFRKAEQDVLDLDPGKYDMIGLAMEVLQSFKAVVVEGNKHLELRTELSSLAFEFDRDKMEGVLYNLIANAISFTGDLGEIILSIKYSEEDQNIRIEVRDTGIGIREEDHGSIFEKFFQSDEQRGSGSSNTGSGIGLYLCRKIVELHRGTIEVISAPGKGSNFTITLPATGARINDPDLPELNDKQAASSGMEMLEAMAIQDPPVHSEDVPLILLVEDHAELRTHLKKMLWKYYRVEEAGNGKTGMEMARELLPDLIVSDIIMPEMDGVQMCQQIKRDPRTEHIPLILLSAKSDQDSKVTGYQMGADDYLEKPFFPEVLLARIRNLIESREKLRTLFGNTGNKKPRIAGLNPLDREFLEKVFYLVEQNIGNGEFNINAMCSEMGISRVHLHRRFKGLTGITAKDYLTETRLKAAAALLEENCYTVSEVAYRVGFNTPSNFTSSFKSFYGISPKDYKQS